MAQKVPGDRDQSLQMARALSEAASVCVPPHACMCVSGCTPAGVRGRPPRFVEESGGRSCRATADPLIGDRRE